MRKWTAVAAVLLLVGITALDMGMEASRHVSVAKKSAIAALCGEFRTVFANLLWIKVDQYHHEYSAHHGDWTKNSDALGLTKMITTLDPHFEEAYATGSRMLIGMGKTADARAYLDQGLTSNPNSMMLHDEMGTLLAVHLKDYKGSLFHLKKAYCIVSQDWEHKNKGRKLEIGPNKLDSDLSDDEFQMRRLKRLIGTVERLLRGEAKATRSVKCKVASVK